VIKIEIACVGGVVIFYLFEVYSSLNPVLNTVKRWCAFLLDFTCFSGGLKVRFPSAALKSKTVKKAETIELSMDSAFLIGKITTMNFTAKL